MTVEPSKARPCSHALVICTIRPNRLFLAMYIEAVPDITNPLIFNDPGIGPIRPIFVDASAECGLERRHEESGTDWRVF